MITAAVEWEFRRLFPNGIKKTPKTIEAEKAVCDCIRKHVNESSGKQKKIYKFLKRLVKSDSLQSEIIHIGKEFSDIIDMFGNRLCQTNNQVLKYSEMGQRLADQRNHFAHGDLSKEFIDVSLLDLVYMEAVIYAMQLKHYQVGNVEIKRAINDLFHFGFNL